MDIPDLESTIHSAARILQPGGWFVFAILHPCFNTVRSGEIENPEGWLRNVGAYFTEGTGGRLPDPARPARSAPTTAP